MKGTGVKIKYITITIQPWLVSHDTYELRIETIADGTHYESRELFKPDDFEAMFDSLTDHAAHRIKAYIKDSTRE